LESALRDSIGAHLADCPACRSYLEDLAQIGRLLRSDDACRVPEGMWGRIATAAQQTPRHRHPLAGGWLARTAAVAAGFLIYVLGFGSLMSSLEDGGGPHAAEAAQIEQVLQETGLALAGQGSFREAAGLLDSSPETRLLSEFVEDAKP
jgi:predicted anti-sigma-YlaC factor YlaD